MAFMSVLRNLFFSLFFISSLAFGWNQRVYFPVDIPQSVQVEVSDGGICSGSVIKDGYILTAAHCAKSRHEYVEIAGTVERFRLVYKGRPASGTDFAIYKGDTHGIEPLQLCRHLPEMPFGVLYISRRIKEVLIPAFAVKTISKFQLAPEIEKSLVLLGDVLPGDSGAPIVGPDGQVVGIVWGGPSVNHEVIFATSCEVIAPVLDIFN